ncbi:MAG: heptose kinase [Gammaproteobacteria bacterium]|nr:heptose kinase [Gammaproteobacteria bacterium]
MSSWRLHADYQHLQDDFGSLERIFCLEGKQITRDPISEVIRIERDGVGFYVKRYRRAKGWRAYLPRPRIKSEWQNLQHFTDWGIPTAQIIARGMERKAGAFVRGAMVTREIPGTDDLARLAYHKDTRLQDRSWVNEVSRQIADFTRTLHQHGFVHNDLKWRNILVDQQRRAYLIDCPTGGFWWGPFLQYRIVKDLACLDKVGKYQLSRSQRLRFYLHYVQRQQLTPADKKRIAKIVRFFAGRE